MTQPVRGDSGRDRPAERVKAMSDVLCVYYSRTGRTREAMQETAQALGAETLELSDAVRRTGWDGWLRCGLDALRRTPPPVSPYETRRPLALYRLVIIGTPVWAGRCSSPVRSFLRAHGREPRNVAYLITHRSENRYEEVYDQMDQYTSNPRVAAVSLRTGSVGYSFWQGEFHRQVRKFLEEGP